MAGDTDGLGDDEENPQINGYEFIVMERAPLGDLFDYKKTMMHQKLLKRETMVKNIALQILNGLRSFQAAGIIHGDIKHIVSNTLPLLVLGMMLFYFYIIYYSF